jgi:hypothetical protein
MVTVIDVNKKWVRKGARLFDFCAFTGMCRGKGTGDDYK